MDKSPSRPLLAGPRGELKNRGLEQRFSFFFSSSLQREKRERGDKGRRRSRFTIPGNVSVAQQWDYRAKKSRFFSFILSLRSSLLFSLFLYFFSVVLEKRGKPRILARLNADFAGDNLLSLTRGCYSGAQGASIIN